jgi:hypothetical protein
MYKGNNRASVHYPKLCPATHIGCELVHGRVGTLLPAVLWVITQATPVVEQEVSARGATVQQAILCDAEGECWTRICVQLVVSE